MNNIVIYGAGGFGREIALMIEQINKVEKLWQVLGFYDDGIKKGTLVDGIPVCGGLADVNAIDYEINMVIAIANPSMRKNIVSAIQNDHIQFPVLAHPNADLGSELNWFGRGCILSAGCILTTNIVLGEFVIVNLVSTIGHDVKLGSFCSVMPSCNISGNVQVGECTMLGTGSKLLQNLSIGKVCNVGAGAVVTKSCEDNLTLVGVPARVINT
jgi:sugar O-acyltransferase (sialic acid O-acetyltransferase NeuD family)